MFEKSFVIILSISVIVFSRYACRFRNCRYKIMLKKCINKIFYMFKPDSHLLASALRLRCFCFILAHCVNMNEASEARVKQERRNDARISKSFDILLHSCVIASLLRHFFVVWTWDARWARSFFSKNKLFSKIISFM